MSIFSQLYTSYFSPRARQHGQEYFESGKVNIEWSTVDFCEAVVNESNRYDITLEFIDEGLLAECTCTHFNEGFFCKHIWAVLKELKPDPFMPSRKNESNPLLIHTLDFDEASEPGPADAKRPSNRPAPPPKRPAPKSWKTILGGMTPAESSLRPGRGFGELDLQYFIDIQDVFQLDRVILQIHHRTHKKDGEWGKFKPFRCPVEELETIPLEEDRNILNLLSETAKTFQGRHYEPKSDTEYNLSTNLQSILLPMLCATGRFFIRDYNQSLVGPLAWDGGNAWTFEMRLRPHEAGDHFLLSGRLKNEADAVPLSDPKLILRTGWICWPDRITRLENRDDFKWISILRETPTLRIPGREADVFMEQLLDKGPPPPLDLPEGLDYSQETIRPQPVLKVKQFSHQKFANQLSARLDFDYGGHLIAFNEQTPGIFERESKRYLHRDLAAEAEALSLLLDHGVKTREFAFEPNYLLELNARALIKITPKLVGNDWRVEAKGKFYRRAGDVKIEVTGKIDWFEVRGTCDFEGVTVDFPALLRAAKRGESTVQLDDGSLGVLPEDWLKKYGLLTGMGKAEDDHIKYTSAQTGILDALISDLPDTRVDEAFAKARDQLAEFKSVKPAEPTKDFQGTLRPYQKDGLGWLRFLQKFGFGGCLADDMGLGKTVQVLALLDWHHGGRKTKKTNPSLVVVPRSLVFNWQLEAKRFAPELRVFEHTGADREKNHEKLGDYDIVITTYGLLRQDIAMFQEIPFEYAVLDEAQAIKNEKTKVAKASRLIDARHRLALSGTPIENHLGELWSLFEFLNPGFLGASSLFDKNFLNRKEEQDPRKSELLARMLAPFFLRRTKGEVAPELPEKTEETVYCEFEPEQKKLYDELKDYYRTSLLKKTDDEGLNRNKFQILEALLRLRQAACHPGLIDEKWMNEKSAKTDFLLERIKEVAEEGHKILVFSQFTSFLKIIRGRLDKAGIVYEYLDGRTRDREEKVRRFQEDPDCLLFLISLKAGGYGLNLTAAEYIFLLDPWWNPAVEAQAIDRAHRIGQTRNVFAYRLIMRDSVEEKVLQLQESKKDLADAIIKADNSLIRNLKREDLELLLN